MQLMIRACGPEDLDAACALWNAAVEAGNAFPREERLTPETGADFFRSRSFAGLACDAGTGEAVGVYVLQPHRTGRCGHVAEAWYAVKNEARGQRVGEQLVLDRMGRAKAGGFRILQPGPVLAANAPAVKLYRKLGFRQLGVLPGGFRLPDGSYADLIQFYIVL